ncbi:MAG: carboxymuconolactone decarboxylase family protein [Microthrixaceae bacterium]
MPRIVPGSRREVGIATAAFARIAGVVARTEPPHVFLTLGRHRRLFRGWLCFAAMLMPGGRLRRRETEMVIVRVAARRGSGYELDQHRRLAQRAGLTPEQVEDLCGEDPASERGATPHRTDVVEGPWSGRDRAILVATDSLLDEGDLDDVTWSRLTAHLDEREVIELVMLVGPYDMLATTLRALRVQPDRPRR